MNTNNKLVINNVTKLYDKRHGIKNISTVFQSGEIIAIIGPNGAGKTTFIKSMAGLLEISEGEILLSDIKTSNRSCKSKIGYMQSDLSFYNRLTVYEILHFVCKVKYEGSFYDEIDVYLRKYNLFEQRNSFINELSLGMKRKLAIIMALIGEPKLILMDEPTNGVDTYGIIQFKEDLLKAAQNGAIILVTSHVLDFLEKICSRCIFMKDGMIAKDIFVENDDLERIYEKLY